MAVKNCKFFKTESELQDYYTPISIAGFCWEQVTEPGPFIEPAAGGGSFLGWMPEDTIAYDVYPQDFGIMPTTDSLEEDWDNRIMVTNPPFRHTRKFITKALENNEVCYLIMQPGLLLAGKLNSSLYLEKLLLFDMNGGRSKNLRSALPFYVNSTGEIKEMFACFAKFRKLRSGEQSNLPLTKKDARYNTGCFITDPFKAAVIPDYAEIVDVYEIIKDWEYEMPLAA